MTFLQRHRNQALLVALMLAGVELARDVIHITGAFALVR
jgi:hypothetical protein